jgi:hypothetical protein
MMGQKSSLRPMMGQENSLRPMMGQENSLRPMMAMLPLLPINLRHEWKISVLIPLHFVLKTGNNMD